MVAVYKKIVIGVAILSSPDETYLTYLAVRSGWENCRIATHVSFQQDVVVHIVTLNVSRTMLYHLIALNPNKDITLHVSASSPAMVKTGKLIVYLSAITDGYVQNRSSTIGLDSKPSNSSQAFTMPMRTRAHMRPRMPSGSVCAGDPLLHRARRTTQVCFMPSSASSPRAPEAAPARAWAQG